MSEKVLVVLGRNWKRRFGFPAHPLELSTESKINAIAAGEMYARTHAGKIIFSGGKTAGQNNYSEARAMWEYVRELGRYDIEKGDVMLEEESIDTSRNAEEVYKLVRWRKRFKDKNGKVLLLSSSLHLPRAERIFRRYSFDVEPVSSEDVVSTIDDEYRQMIDKYLESCGRLVDRIKEELVSKVLWFDKSGKIARPLTNFARRTLQNVVS